jgi:hypothetical protein
MRLGKLNGTKTDIDRVATPPEYRVPQNEKLKMLIQ